MHPEIKEFWKKCGFEIELGPNGHYWFQDKTAYPNCAVFINPLESVPERKLQYFYPNDVNGKWYYEADMLRLIKLKAFL